MKYPMYKQNKSHRHLVWLIDTSPNPFLSFTKSIFPSLASS